MNPNRTVFATWLAMLTLQTVGSIDTKHKLPAPKQYVAIGTLWGILFLLADAGLAKLAARLSLLILLTASVLGPFGKRLVQLLEMVSKRFAIAPQAGPAGPSGPTIIPGVYVPGGTTSVEPGFAPGTRTS